MVSSLTANKVTHKRIGSYGLRCQHMSVRFEMEIAHLEHLENIYLVRFKRLAGEMQQFKEVSGKVLERMNLSSSNNGGGNNAVNMASESASRPQMSYVY